MSTGLECLIREIEPGQWYYILERWDSPKGAFDWREYADAFGPFPTEEAAITHLQSHHANPGGWWTGKYDGRPLDDVMKKLVKEATR
jgi:hypothetical protein